MSIVWIVNPTDKDLSAAAEYGEIRYVNTRHVYGDEINGRRLPEELRGKFLCAAKLFDPSMDYLLLIGDQLQLVLFAAKLGLAHGQFRVLRWDQQAKGYLACWVGA